MGKSASQKQEVTKFFMSQHFGICTAPVDALLEIIIKEKSAWTGTETDLNAFVIEQDQLFGGNKKEGGVEGVVHWLPGASDQVLPDVLAQKLGRADGNDAPGYRGIASAFFTGPVGTEFADYDWDDKRIRNNRGFYWSANNPYLPGVWCRVRRAPIGLDPDYALIGPLAEQPELTGEVILTWWQRSPGGDDTGRMGITFVNSSGAEIEPITWATLTAPTSYTERNLSATCPAGTVAIRFYMYMDRNVGGNNDAHIDDISATLDAIPLTIINPGAETNNLAGWTRTVGHVDATATVAHGGTHSFDGGKQPISAAYQDVSFTPTGDDANPAHIIYEALTNTDWGMGSPETAIDKAGFEAIALALYAESFGLSMIWTRQASIQDFIQEVLDHIQAVLFVDPSTGLLTLKLIRGDYDAETLPDINPSNAVLTDFSRKQWGDIINEIEVTWTNPANEQEETVIAQDLASITTQGGIVSDGRNYYGVRNASLAAKLAQRDLRSAGAPLATCEVEIDRTLWTLRPASVVKITWPEHGLDGVVFRVTSVDYGRPGDATIKLSLAEDIFGLDFGDYVEPPSSEWEDSSEAPEPLTIERLFTLPLFFANQSPAAAFIETPVYPEVVAGVLGTTDQLDAYGHDLWDEVTLSNGDLEWQEIAGNLNIIGHAELTGALAAEATSAAVAYDTLIGDTSPTAGGFVIIGDGGEDENEIAMVDAISTGAADLIRGVLDTVPRAWPAGTPMWFVDEETIFEDPTVRSAGDTYSVKLLTRTSLGRLALADATLVSHTLTERPWLPNRPADVQVASVLFNTVDTPVDMTGRADPWVTISWVNRNRLTEDSQVLSWTDATVTPETGQTTGIRVFAEDGTTLIDEINGLSGTSHDVPDASFGSEAVVLIQPFGERSDDDGDFVSLQAHGIWVQVAVGEPITEDGDNIITEDGDEAIYEG